MRHIHARNAQLEFESKFTLDLPNCSTLWRPHTLDVNSAIRHAIRHSPLGYLPFPHSDPPDLDRALHATERIDPATALPFELMSKIFVHVYEAAPLLRRSDQIAHTVACVSTQWRDIALASPALWATISVGNWTGRTGDYTELALARSKGTPIMVACISQSCSVFEEFMGLVLPHIARWRSVILLYSLNTPPSPIAYGPHFESAFIDVLPSPYIQDFTFLARATNARQIALWCNVYSFTFALPASQTITDLMASVYTPDQFSALISAVRSLPNLENLGVHSLWCSRDRTTSGVVAVPALTSLTVSEFGYFILDHLFAPNLRTVVVKDGHGSLESLSSFAERNDPFGTMLRHLEISIRADEVRVFRPFLPPIWLYLERFGSIQEFALTYYWV